MRHPARWLQIAFVTGAVIDGLAAIAMLIPGPGAELLGLPSNGGGAYRFAMGYGASLMAGWTALLAWAARRPVERRFVAVLTAVPVLCGLALTEVAAVAAGLIELPKLLPLLVFQHLAMLVFAVLYRATGRAVVDPSPA